MLRRDLLTAEIKKLAEALARILGLKKEGQTEEADVQLQEMLEREYGLSYKDLHGLHNADFLELLHKAQFPAEKLDVLTQILYSIFEPTKQDKENQAIATKLQSVYQLLVTEYRIINMINLERETVIKNYLNTTS
ncbi:hypothetical protein [Pedobacter nutrimenti]|uniref:Uncharacterized protein n=1 Tax=Pedobacter nutrimenti TaxID=1241337 RepID=A0A318UA80_9SPHI|nr:hypothetical protein [Pedobacter nutrimenti]PYF68377.1 hypothetical protein B0O44_11410 [Pedobacter nutrimenti]